MKSSWAISCVMCLYGTDILRTILVVISRFLMYTRYVNLHSFMKCLLVIKCCSYSASSVFKLWMCSCYCVKRTLRLVVIGMEEVWVGRGLSPCIHNCMLCAGFVPFLICLSPHKCKIFSVGVHNDIIWIFGGCLFDCPSDNL
jgi:hypothetical protein